MAALYFPQARGEHLAIHCEWIAWGFIADDLFDDGPLGRDPRSGRDASMELIEVLHGGAPRGVLGGALHDLWLRSSSGRSAGWHRDRTECLADWVWSLQEDVWLRMVPRDLTFEEYVELRRHTIAMYYFGCAIAETGAGIDIPEYVRHLSHLRALRNQVLTHVALLNDVFSYPRDVALGNQNSVAIAMRSGRTREQAVAEIVGRVDGCIAKIEHHQAALLDQLTALRASAADMAQVEQLIPAYRCLVRGNHDWHYVVDRYVDPSYDVTLGTPDYVTNLFA
jgi:(+)-beta-caryophyllene/(+)-caryolan-1-ol synthase